MPRTIRAIATEAARDITATNQLNGTRYARPYLTAMLTLETMADSYGLDLASEIVARFLCNAGQWRGSEARRIKAELNAMLKAARS